MLKIEFYETGSIDDNLLDFAVIVSKYKGKLVLCKAKNRDTWELPGGRREAGENIADTAKRELAEETGAIEFDINQACVYAVVREERTTYGLLFCADIKKLGALPESEIERIDFFDTLPDKLTYPLIQPALLKKVYKQ